MTLPDQDSLVGAGGALADYSPVIDSSTDRSAAGANTAYANAQMATRTNTRAVVRFNPTGGSPVLAASGEQYNAVWLATTATAPVLAHSSTGVYTITWPATVMDEIPATLPTGQATPGYNANGHSVNFKSGWWNAELGATTPYLAFVTVAANVITVKIYSVGSSPALTDPNDGTVFAIYAR